MVQGARMWPYTYMDCEFNRVIQMGADKYCSGIGTDPNGDEISCDACREQCTLQWTTELGNPADEIVAHLTAIESAMMLCASTECVVACIAINVVVGMSRDALVSP
jgi:hypothetical protein